MSTKCQVLIIVGLGFIQMKYNLNSQEVYQRGKQSDRQNDVVAAITEVVHTRFNKHSKK